MSVCVCGVCVMSVCVGCVSTWAYRNDWSVRSARSEEQTTHIVIIIDLYHGRIDTGPKTFYLWQCEFLISCCLSGFDTYESGMVTVAVVVADIHTCRYIASNYILPSLFISVSSMTSLPAPPNIHGVVVHICMWYLPTGSLQTNRSWFRLPNISTNQKMLYNSGSPANLPVIHSIKCGDLIHPHIGHSKHFSHIIHGGYW